MVSPYPMHAVSSTSAATSSSSVLSSPSAAVYLDYGETPPPHPGEGWTRFVCISDTHSNVFPVPLGDVLLHSGDLSSWGTLSQLKFTVDWLAGLSHPVKIVIAGNHDLCLDRKLANASKYNGGQNGTPREIVDHAQSLMRGETAREAGIRYLEHESMDLVTSAGKHWKIYGSPAAPRYVDGSFQYTTAEQAKAIYDRIPEDTEILLTHTPPHLTLDTARRGTRAGCSYLSRRVEQLQECRLHVFGHIHEAHGAMIHAAREGSSTRRVSVNAALPWKGQAIIVDLKH